MTPAEVAYRALRAIQARAERSGIARERSVPAPDLAARRIPGSRPERKGRCRNSMSTPAERIAHGWIDVFALRNVNLGSPPRWNRDPKTGIEAPLAFGKLLDYRNPRRGRRHQVPVGAQPPPAPRHAGAGVRAHRQARVLRRHRRAPRQLVPRLPYGYGPNWSSALEAGLRLINWSADLAAARRPEILEEGNGRVPRPLAGLDLPARAVHPRLVLAAFVGQQPPDRRGGGPVHRRAHLAAAGRRRRAGARPRKRSSSARRWCRTRPTA